MSTHSEDPSVHAHAAETHRKAAQSYADAASSAAAMGLEKAYKHNDNMRHFHSEQMTFALRRAQGLDPDTGRPFVWD